MTYQTEDTSTDTAVHHLASQAPTDQYEHYRRGILPERIVLWVLASTNECLLSRTLLQNG